MKLHPHFAVQASLCCSWIQSRRFWRFRRWSYNDCQELFIFTLFRWSTCCTSPATGKYMCCSCHYAVISALILVFWPSIIYGDLFCLICYFSCVPWVTFTACTWLFWCLLKLAHLLLVDSYIMYLTTHSRITWIYKIYSPISISCSVYPKAVQILTFNCWFFSNWLHIRVGLGKFSHESAYVCISKPCGRLMLVSS